ncbi:MAG: CvpA family protein [Pirellulales bacterium]|nr:CvpA family protein [Pirellulales bacterium]
MSTIFTVLLFVVFLAVVASLYTEGMWGNALRLVEVTTSALLATNFFEPLARWVEGWSSTMASYTYVWDYLALWVLFAASMVVLRGISDFLCHVKVRFLKIADQVGSILFSCLTALVVVGFVTFSLHTAPLAKNFMWGGFTSDPSQKMMLGLGPDRIWMALVRQLSEGAFACRSPRPFPADEYRASYEQRRGEIEKHVKDTNAIRVGG